jgi:uncharacterized membrane protein (UPF0127 family)
MDNKTGGIEVPMKTIYIQKTGRPLSKPIETMLCASFLCRLRGWMFRRQMALHQGLLLVGESESRWEAAIHMLGVCQDLGVLWLDRRLRVVDKRLARAWRPMYIPRHPAKYVLEIAPERLEEFEIGDEIQLDTV